MSLHQQATPSLQTRNKSHTHKNWAKVENYLTDVEKVQGLARAWELRGRLERGDVRLGELSRF